MDFLTANRFEYNFQDVTSIEEGEEVFELLDQLLNPNRLLSARLKAVEELMEFDLEPYFLNMIISAINDLIDQGGLELRDSPEGVPGMRAGSESERLRRVYRNVRIRMICKDFIAEGAFPRSPDGTTPGIYIPEALTLETLRQINETVWGADVKYE
ncbi:hypothetical protein HOG17_03870 [Candidatus Peregrinibacteria bacterium]|jgi:hypothetical protein|nr:hypothetical protein [Candidatus Peregrinibacteria bacterium]MBT4148341.1 hypothetical protein [Candidatus Peregrinibacteria bacterium]MBT4366378.1 hypothetical protein [Candidatus Peregrinibacteria bacterium]MBT4455906.1 hypothetical protein [Candidatus Peregrinibacteria bacterium]